MNENKQIIKGDNCNQQTIIVNGNYQSGMNKEEVCEMIMKYGSVNKDEIINLVKKVIDDIKEEDRVLPNKRVFVPAIQQLSYCIDDVTIKDTFQKLLSSSMKKSKSDSIHPSFINIISQLTSDEVKILNALPPFNYVLTPLINLRMKFGNKNDKGIVLVSNFSDIGYGVCERPQNIGFYIENLERLKLIEVPSMLKISNEKEYEKVKTHPAILQVIRNNKVDDSKIEQKFEFDERFFQLTTLGINFLDVCIK